MNLHFLRYEPYTLQGLIEYQHAKREFSWFLNKWKFSTF